jgi:hypothetical protein
MSSIIKWGNFLSHNGGSCCPREERLYPILAISNDITFYIIFIIILCASEQECLPDMKGKIAPSVLASGNIIFWIWETKKTTQF